MFRCDGDVMESLDLGGSLGNLNTPHTPGHLAFLELRLCSASLHRSTATNRFHVDRRYRYTYTQPEAEHVQ